MEKKIWFLNSWNNRKKIMDNEIFSSIFDMRKGIGFEKKGLSHNIKKVCFISWTGNFWNRNFRVYPKGPLPIVTNVVVKKQRKSQLGMPTQKIFQKNIFFFKFIFWSSIITAAFSDSGCYKNQNVYVTTCAHFCFEYSSMFLGKFWRKIFGQKTFFSKKCAG